LCEVLADTADLEQHVAWFDHRDVVIGCALARAHAGFGWLGRNDLVWKDADPDFTASLEMVGNCPTGGLDLAGGDPRRFEGADRELAEGNRVAAHRDAAHATVGALHHLAMLHALG